MSSEIICAIFISSLLVSGCYSSAVVTTEDPDPKDKTVIFYLKDGSSVSSPAGHHLRTDSGYQVLGTLYNTHDRKLGEFAGAIQDSAIMKVSAYEYNASRTGLTLGVIVAVVVASCVGAVVGMNLSGGSLGGW
jgi:hypothetical protein